LWRFRHLLVPDLALAMAGVTLFTCLFLFGGTTRLFRDSDTGWHIRIGEQILDTRLVPRTDPFSFSRAGRPWIAWEWAVDLAMGWLHRQGGVAAVAWMYGVVIAAGIWFWLRLTWRAGGDFLIACAFLPLVWTTGGLHWLARPHVVGWIWLLITLMAAERTDLRFRARHGAAALVLAAVWANTHPSFVLGLAVLVLYVVGESVAWLLWNKAEWQRARWCGLALLCGAPGTLLTPYGLALHHHVLAYLRDTELLSRVAEFQSFNFHAEGASTIALTLALTALGAACALVQRNPGRFLVLSFFAAMALQTARGLPLAAMAALPLANGCITLGLLRVRDLRPALHRGLNAFLAYSGNLRKLDAGVGGLVWAPVLGGLAFAILSVPAVGRQVSFSSQEFPVEASAAVAQLPAEARILAPDKFGGYLIYRFGGRRKVYFDGRSDFYGAAFMRQYIRLIEVRPGWEDALREFDFTHALVPSDGSLRAALQSAGWQIVYKDRVAWLLSRPRGSE
jgi:hypothetical protein